MSGRRPDEPGAWGGTNPAYAAPDNSGPSRCGPAPGHCQQTRSHVGSPLEPVEVRTRGDHGTVPLGRGRPVGGEPVMPELVHDEPLVGTGPRREAIDLSLVIGPRIALHGSLPRPIISVAAESVGTSDANREPSPSGGARAIAARRGWAPEAAAANHPAKVHFFRVRFGKQGGLTPGVARPGKALLWRAWVRLHLGRSDRRAQRYWALAQRRSRAAAIRRSQAETAAERYDRRANRPGGEAPAVSLLPSLRGLW